MKTRKRQIGPTFIACLGLVVGQMGCGSKSDSLALASFAEVSVNSPIAAMQEKCGANKCAITHSVFEEIEFLPDSAGKIKAVVLRCPAPAGGVQASQERFAQVRGVLRKTLGEGETFLATADPSYWPRRRRQERVVTLTIDDNERTVLAIGPGGPDAEKIPATGAANNRPLVQSYWIKILGTPSFDQ